MLQFLKHSVTTLLTPSLRSFTSRAEAPLYFCIVGTGPAGFYTADRLLKRLGRQVRVDLLDRLPTPFGLVRSGVAPDHQPTKNVTNQFSAVAADDRVRFLGNVRVGVDVSLNELRAMYTGVVLCAGAESDRKLGIPGEEGPGVYSARQFVWWYNGHPDCNTLPVDMSKVKSVAVCGIGNVALDCARVLLRSVTDGPLATSDIASHALDQLKLATTSPREVHLVARRGPVQAACTAKELKELVSEPGVKVVSSPDQMSVSEEEQNIMKKERSRRRIYEIISQAVRSASTSAADSQSGRQLHFQFYRQPKRVSDKSLCGYGRVVRDPSTGAVVGLEVEKTALERAGPGLPARAVGTGVTEVIPADLILVSIGYKSLPVKGAAFDPERGVIPNVAGRVLLQQSSAANALDGTAEVDPGLYVCGWIKRGPTGIIGTNAADAEETVSSILQDVQAARLPWPQGAHVHSQGAGGGAAAGVTDPGQQLLSLLQHRGVQVVDWAGWQSIDTAELRRGSEVGRVRDKITDVAQMLTIAAGE